MLRRADRAGRELTQRAARPARRRQRRARRRARADARGRVRRARREAQTERPLRLLGARLAAPAEDAERGRRSTALLGVALAAVLRHDRVPDVPGGRERRRRSLYAALGAERDGHLVGDEHDRGLGAAAGALARHARAARRGADATSRSCCCRSRSRWRRSASTAWSRRCSGAAFVFGIDLHDRAPARCSCSRSRRRSCRSAMLGFLLAVAGRPLPHRVGARQRARVPGLARSAASSCRSRCCPDWVRPISWVLAPTWGVRAIREAALGGDAAAATCSMCARARRRLRRDRRSLLAERVLRLGADARRAALLADVTARCAIFFVGGLTATGRCSAGCARGSSSRRSSSRRSSRSCSSSYIGRSAALESDEFYVIGNAAAVRGDPVPVRDDEHDRRRALASRRSGSCSPRRRAGSRCSSAARCR